MIPFRSAWSRPAITASVLLLGSLGSELFAQPVITLPYVNAPLYTRPNGSNFYWTYPTYENSVFEINDPRVVTSVSYYNVGPPTNYALTRGKVQYATSTAGPWTDFPSPATTSYVTTAGRVFRFVDTLGDNTTQNAVGMGWNVVGHGSPITSGSNVFPDLPPTDVYPRTTDYWGTPALNDEISLLDVTDTGARFNYGGRFSIDSQSVPNLFAISGNKLVKGSGTLPAVDGTATVTLRYNDLFQLDNSGNPVSGQGVTRTVTMTRRGNPATLTNELQVNTYTVGNQNSSSVAGLSDGSYVVVWRSDAQGEATGMGGIYAQKFTSAGVKSGGEFAISDSGNGINEVTPTVSALNNGRFVVVYTKVNTDNDIRFRIVEANGSVGAETAVPSSDTGAQGAPASTSLVGGGFAVTWVAPGTGNDIYSRRFTDAGAPVAGTEGIVNTLVAGGQATPFISGLSNGDYVVVWRESAAGNGDIRFRVMGPTGQMAADAAATPDAGSQTNGRVAGLTGGGFVVLYAESGRTEGVVTDGSNGSTENNVYGQRFNSAGAAQGGEFLVHGNARGNQSTPAVMGLSGGGFVAAWVGNTDPDETSGVYARRFDASGTATENDFQLSQRRVGDQTQPALARLADNGLAASWSDETLDGDNNAVASRMLSGAAPLPNLTINDVTLNEGNSGTTTFTFTVSLSAPAPAGDVTLDYATSNGTATTANNDYTAANGSLTIAAGNTSTTFTVTVNGDTTIEPNETFFVNLTNITNAIGTDIQGLGMINNDDADTIPPDTIITANPTNPTNDNTPTFTFSGSDNWTTTGSLTYEVSVNGTAFTAATSPFTPAVLPDGSNTFQVRAKDAANNVDPTPASYTFVIDTAPPAAPVATNPVNGSHIATTTPNYTGTAEANSTVTVLVDGSSIGIASAGPTGNWTKAQPTALSQGSHTVRATATDAAGNTSVSSNTNAFTVDTTPPAAPVTVTPANGSQTVDDTPTYTGTAEPSSTVTVLVDGSSIGTTAADGAGNWSKTQATALSLGSHTVRSTATDAAGNASPSSNTNTFTVYAPVTLSGTLTASGSFVPNGTVTYTATLTNNSSAPSLNSTGNEFTLALPSQLTLVSATSTSGSASTSGSTVNWNGGIAASGSVTITITATVKADATGTVSAQGSISYDTDSNGSNDATAVTDDPSVTGANNPTVFEIMPDKVSLAHAITTTSVGGNDGVATIGETVTHAITVTVPDGVTSGLVVRGSLPAGLSYVAGSTLIQTSGFNGTVGSATTNSSGGVYQITFSPIDATADNNAANNKFTIGLQTTVQDVVGNVGVTPQTTLTLGFTHNNGGLDPDFTAPLANASVTVVEARLVASTVINETSANVGGTVTFGVGVQNTGTSPAHGVSGSLNLPATHFNLATFGNEILAGDFVLTLNPATGLLIYSSPTPLPAGASAYSTFTINLAANAPAGPYTTPVLVTQASTLAGNVSGERSYTVNGSTDTLAIFGPPGVTAPVLGTTTVNEGATVSHTVSGSFTDNNGTFTGVVDWGDGSTSPLTINNAAKTYSYTGNHTYAQNGSYTVTVKVTNAQSYTGTSAATTVTVNNVAPVVAAPSAPSPEAAVAGVSTSFTISGFFTDPAGSLDAPYTAVVNWGDGTTSVPSTTIGSGNPFGYTIIENHTYATTGAKTVTVTVTDGNGDSTTSDPITVQVVGGADYAVTTTSTQVTVTDNSGNGDTLTVSAPSAGQIRFAAPNRNFSVNGGPLITGSSGNLSLSGITGITINPAGGDDIVTFNSMANLPSLTINDGAGTDQVWVDTILTFANGNSFQASAEVFTVYPAGRITTATTGTIRVLADALSLGTGAGINSPASVELAPLTAGRVILLGGENASALSIMDAELDTITTPSLIIGSPDAGQISVEGGASPANASALVLRTAGSITNSALYLITPSLSLEAGTGIGAVGQPLQTQAPVLSATTSTGSIIITSHGAVQVGGATSNGILVAGGNGGVTLRANGSIDVTKQIKAPGAVSVTTTGAASDILVTAGGSAIQSTAAGITIVGGRDIFMGGMSNYGDLSSAGATVISAANDVVVNTTSYVLSGGPLTATVGGDFTISSSLGLGSVVQITGSGDMDITAAGVITINGGTSHTMAANGGAITLKADQLDIPPTGIDHQVNTTGVVTIKPYAAARPVSVGGVSANELSLTDALLDKVTAGSLVLGDSNAGALTVMSTISRAASTNVTLASGGDVILAGTIQTAGGNLTLIPGTAPAKVKSLVAGTDTPLGGGRLAINGRLELTLNGATAGAGYEQLVVNGTVDASATTLVLTGSHVPVTGNTFTLVSNDGTDAVTGNFVGLPEGSTVTFNGVLMRITYVGGDGNDIVLGLANRAPTNITLAGGTLPENSGANAEVGTLSSTDPDTGDTFTYTLVSGTGDTDNAAFNIFSGNKLRLNASANYEAKSSYSVRIRTTDQGSLFYEKQFTITITDVAENPTITAIDDIMIDEDTATGALDFSIADQDAGSNLTVTATSDNQALVPNANIILGGTGANRSIYVAPVANGFGVAEITVVVSDGVLTGSTTYTVTVNSVNDEPVVVGGIPDVTLVASDRTTSLNLETYFSDIETASSAMTYTVTPAPGAPFHNLTRTGNTLNIAATAPGEVVITVTAQDADTATVTDSFILRVKHVPEIAGTGIPDTLLSPASTGLDIILGSYFLDQDSDALTYTIAGNNHPELVSGAIDGDTLTLHPLGAGVATFTIRATDIDGNFIDHTFDVTVNQPVPDPVPTVTSPPKLNRQTGLWEITLTATNNNVFNVPGFRFRVTSELPSHIRLYNSTAPVGSNEPYLDVLTMLPPGQAVTVVLEFHSTTRNFTGFNPTIIAEPLPEGTSNVGDGVGMEINRFVNLADGSKLIEFSSIAGRWYEIQYSADLITWKRSLVPVQAGANFTQWIDRGAPYTESHPSTVPSRFYRVSEIVPD